MIENKPFIKLLQSPNGYYFYDVNRNEVVPIRQETYDYLENLLDSNRSSDSLPPAPFEVGELKEAGYLSSEHVKEIEHIYTEYVPHILERNLEKVTLQLTQNCNFRCKYCNYTNNSGNQRHHSSKRMSEETARKAVLFLRDHCIDTEEVFLGFYGGEPMLEFDLLKRMVLFAEEVLKGKRLLYTITTNATLLTEEMIAFFVAHKAFLVISIDGTKSVNDRNRVFANGQGSTFDAIIEKLRYIYDAYPDYFRTLSINMVVDPSTDFDEVSRLFVDYPFLLELSYQWTEIDDIMSPTPNTVTEEYVSKRAHQTFLAYLHRFSLCEEKHVSALARRAVFTSEDSLQRIMPSKSLGIKSAPGGPCVPGESRLMVTVDGKFIACERVSETSEPMIIGDIDHGFDLDKVIHLLNVAKQTESACKNCWAFNLCSLCGKFSDDHGTLSGKRRLEFCDHSRGIASGTLQDIIFFQEMEGLING